jgi:hypothetical protein
MHLPRNCCKMGSETSKQCKGEGPCSSSASNGTTSMGSCSESSTTGKREAQTVDFFYAENTLCSSQKRHSCQEHSVRYWLILLFELCTLDSLFNHGATLQISCKSSGLALNLTARNVRAWILQDQMPRVRVPNEKREMKLLRGLAVLLHYLLLIDSS